MVEQRLLDDLLALPTSDRWELLERLQESLQDDTQVPPLSDEQSRELDRRYAAFLADPTAGYTLEEARALLDARHGS